MKKIIFVRHAKSSWDNPELSDHDRPLNKRGLRDAPFMAKFLKEKEQKPDLIISSSAKRALTTANYFAAAFGIEPSAIEVKKELYLASESEVLEVLEKVDDQHKVVLIFGHNPTYTDLVNRFNEGFIDNVPTCGIGVVEANADHWKNLSYVKGQLVAFYYPKQFKK